MARKSTGSKTDNVQEVTDRIVAALEAGVNPWKCPWTGGVHGGLPFNGHSGRVYHGVNVLLLWLSGYTDPRWYTYKQVSEGGYGESHVRKGEKGTKITFWTFFKKTETDAAGNETETSVPFLRVYTVFNHSQVEWADGKEPGVVETTDPAAAYEAAEAYFGAVTASVTHAGGRACYSRVTDSITLPPRATFKTEADYWATRAHETVHWTGHADRCDREFGKRFGDMAYAAEELVAEMGSAFLCAALGVEGKLQHEEYVAHWVKTMKADK